jgi:hypothetical protein
VLDARGVSADADADGTTGDVGGDMLSSPRNELDMAVVGKNGAVRRLPDLASICSGPIQWLLRIPRIADHSSSLS